MGLHVSIGLADALRSAVESNALKDNDACSIFNKAIEHDSNQDGWLTGEEVNLFKQDIQANQLQKPFESFLKKAKELYPDRPLVFSWEPGDTSDALESCQVFIGV